eukprot:CAMPEP_0197347766 /NCGR_PEP_ID=MMETSP0893-20130614/7735_1 /TAXON_ID=44058 ORGANISM="Aureoumbra lagunensis, Strain CCMP1510" /NCGR_SAMPLE_ID=MMETSP0893 /ASSEMBLY_ACC=CAM_ASM_000539 /LENGTH=50 /DNA_ID=CAMNT_0042857873 /DNA_START=451 /DNA_END=603 /DNA_ORIENTATION=-
MDQVEEQWDHRAREEQESDIELQKDYDEDYGQVKKYHDYRIQDIDKQWLH